MNYIKRLQAENESAYHRLAQAADEVHEFISHIHSDKFTGMASDGSRNDWIATKDVHARLQNILDRLTGLEAS